VWSPRTHPHTPKCDLLHPEGRRGRQANIREPINYFREAAVIKDLLKDIDSRMRSAISVLEHDLSGIRTGRAHPGLVEKIQVEYYGAETPLMQLASISAPDPRSLLIKPFDKSTLKAVERAILASDLGLTPNNDGQAVRLNLPVLTEERRRDLVKVVNHRIEDSRIAVRNVRRDGMKDLKEFESEKLISEDERKRGEDDLQKMVEKVIAEIDSIGKRKEQEIMEV
jgi:ribosome recycling factor